MKNQILTMSFFTTLFLSFISCSSDDNESLDTIASTPDIAELRLAIQADTTEEQSFAIIENAYVESEEVTRNGLNSFFPDCATVTVNPNGDLSGTITVSFEDNCMLNNGAIVSGGVLINYESPDNGSRTITYEYQDLTYNGNVISGGGTLVRTLENTQGNPQSQLNASVSVFFVEQDVTATRSVNRLREWVEGVGSGTWLDNAFNISGNWDTSFSSGFNRSGVTDTVLRREASCPNIVSGVLAITQNNFEGTLDYGDGTCDSIAVITINGVDYTIEL